MNKYDPNIHHRRSIRLKGYDYSQEGAYFITICCQDRECRFGKIAALTMMLNDAGKMVEIEWLKLTERFPNIELHEFVVMPNHFHAILKIVGNGVGAPLVGAQNEIGTGAQNVLGRNDDNEIKIGQPQGITPTIAPTITASGNKTVGDMIDAFKSITTVEYILGVKNLGWQPFNRKLWQRNYHEHIIRDEQSYQNISNYIINNPAKWNDDKFYMQ